MTAFRYSSAAALVLLAVGLTHPIFAQVTPEELNGSHNLGALTFPGAGDSEAELLQRLMSNYAFMNLRPNPAARPKDLAQQKPPDEATLELLKKNGLSKAQLNLVRKNPALLKLAKELANEQIKLGKGLPKGDQADGGLANSALMKEIQKRVAESQQRSRPDNANETPPVASDEPDRNAKPPESVTSNEGNAAAKRETSRSGGENPPDSGGPHLPFGPRLGGWAEKLASINPSFRDSPSMQKAVQSLTESMGGEDPKWRKLAEAGSNLRERMNDWGKTAGLERFWPKGQFHIPDGALERLPHITNRAIADQIPRDVSIPQLGRPDASAGGMVTALAWVVGIAVGAFALRRILLQRQEVNRERRRKEALLRAWPVDPQGVNNRDDLVRAYEYLALSRLGMVVRSWNHVAIAASLGNSPDPLRRNAASSLTDAYEHARYAPLDEALPGEMILEARRHLCLLAGVSGA